MEQNARKKTLVTLLLDRSASMHAIKQSTIDGVNAWLAKLRKSEDDMRFSLIQFDYHAGDPEKTSAHAPDGAVPAGQALGSFGAAPRFGGQSRMQLEKTYVAVPVREVPDLTGEAYQPRGGTPLIDAAYTTIRAIEESLAGRDDVNVILAIQTDGQELNSTENSWDSLKALVQEKEKAGWEILFMGAGIDAYKDGERMGVSRGKTLSYSTDAMATRAAFETTAEKSVLYASGVSASMDYSDEEKARAGDAG